VSPVHLGIGAVCAAAVAGLFLWLQVREDPSDQYFAFVNDYEDATCVMDFFDGTKHRFSSKVGSRYTRTFKAPKLGFVIMRCQTASGVKEAPGHLHLVNGGLTDATFNPQGEIEARYWDDRRH
jgi:hypothetical protein